MSTFDIVLLVILGAFVVSGLFKGIIRLVGHVVALIAGAWIASHFYLTLYEWGQGIANGHENAGKVVAFILLFAIATRLIILVFVLLEKVFKFVAVIPGSKYINNLLGAALGFLEGSLALGLVIYVASRYSFVGNFFGDQLVNSAIAPFLLKMANLALPLLPAALKALQSII